MLFVSRFLQGTHPSPGVWQVVRNARSPRDRDTSPDDHPLGSLHPDLGASFQEGGAGPWCYYRMKYPPSCSHRSNNKGRLCKKNTREYHGSAASTLEGESFLKYQNCFFIPSYSTHLCSVYEHHAVCENTENALQRLAESMQICWGKLQDPGPKASIAGNQCFPGVH